MVFFVKNKKSWCYAIDKKNALLYNYNAGICAIIYSVNGIKTKMTEKIIKTITDAEALALEYKTEAEAKAEKLLADTEQKISLEEKKVEEELRAYREENLKKAKEEAQARFETATEQSHREAKAYCAEVLKNADLEINEIVGRLIRGNR